MSDNLSRTSRYLKINDNNDKKWFSLTEFSKSEAEKPLLNHLKHVGGTSADPPNGDIRSKRYESFHHRKLNS